MLKASPVLSGSDLSTGRLAAVSRSAMNATDEATRLLHALPGGDPQVAARLFDIVHDELHRVAVALFHHERADHTLQPTALVNEVFVRLVSQSQSDWQSRAHFLCVAAKAMRRILVDHARGRDRAKRGGRACRVTLEQACNPVAHIDHDLLDLEDALQRMAAMDPRQSQIVELRFFGGMTVPEIAHVLNISTSTVEADWRMARAWFRRVLSRGECP